MQGKSLWKVDDSGGGFQLVNSAEEWKSRGHSQKASESSEP